jgi:hypothetical protein
LSNCSKKILQSGWWRRILLLHQPNLWFLKKKKKKKINKCMSLKTNLWLAVSCRKPEVKIRVTWHLMFSKKKISLSFISISFISSHHSLPSYHPHFTSLPSTHSFIHPFIPFHFINKVFFRQLKYFMQLEDFITVPAAIWQFCSRLAFLQPSAPAQETQSVWRKYLQFKIIKDKEERIMC